MVRINLGHRESESEVWDLRIQNICVIPDNIILWAVFIILYYTIAAHIMGNNGIAEAVCGSMPIECHKHKTCSFMFM